MLTALVGGVSMGVVAGETQSMLQKSENEPAAMTVSEFQPKTMTSAAHALLQNAMQSSDPKVMARASDFMEAMKNETSKMRRAILEEHQKDYDDVVKQNNNIALCNTQRKNDFESSSSGVDLHNKKVVDHRKSHAECRSQEVDALKKAKDDCQDADQKSVAVNTNRPGCLDSMDTNNRDEQVKCMEKVETWMETHGEAVIKAVDKCDASTKDKDSKVKQCDDKQGDFESEFCTYSTKLTAVCSQHTTCFSNAVNTRTKLIESVKDKAVSQAELWQSLAGMKCLLDIFETAKSSNVEASRFDDCLKKPAVDTANFTHSFPDHVLQDACDTSSAAWNHTEYFSFPIENIDKMKSCIPDSPLDYVGGSGLKQGVACQGDCDYDSDCQGELLCYERSNGEKIPGCEEGGHKDSDYCFSPWGLGHAPLLVSLGARISDHTGKRNLRMCQGDCNNDADCEGDLKCFQRNAHEKVPGCDSGGDMDLPGRDYCTTAAAISEA